MARHAHINWDLPTGELNWGTHVVVAVLMDIRDVLNRIASNTSPLTCKNAQDIPRILRKIAANTDRFKCREHPRYQAILPPRSDCRECRRMYRRRHP